MTSGAGNSLEDEIEIDPVLAAAACLRHDGDINEGIHRILQATSLSASPKRNYVAARSTLYSWRAGKIPASSPTAPRGVVAAVYRLTGIDVSHGAVLTRGPLSLSQLVLLYPSAVKRISNQPDANGAETYQITVPFVRLWAAEMDVKSSWWRRASADAQAEPTTVGKFHFSVPEARLEVTNLEEHAGTPLIQLRPGDADKPGKIEGGFLAWNGGNSWQLVVQEVDFKPAAILTDATLGTVKSRVGAALTFEVQTEERHIRTDFQLASGVASAGGPRSEMIERLMSIILAKRRDGMGTLAVHVVDTK